MEIPVNGGNTTKGATRRGNRRGRPGGYPPGTVALPTTLYLSEEHVSIALLLGIGTTVTGIRNLLSAVAPLLYSTIPGSSLDAKEFIHGCGDAVRGDAARALARLNQWVASVAEEMKATPPDPVKVKTRFALLPATASHKKYRLPTDEETKAMVAELKASGEWESIGKDDGEPSELEEWER